MTQHLVGTRVRRLTVALACTTLIASAAATAPAAATSSAAAGDDAAAAARAFGASAGPAPAPGTYIVVLNNAPSAAREGLGYDSRSASTRQYEARLRAEQDAVLDRVGNPSTLYRYTTTVNGFSAELTSDEVVALRKDRAVLSVQRSEQVTADTVHTPKFLGLSGPHGQWAQHGGFAKAGEDVVVGVLDTGIWPENPSFKADQPAVGAVPGFHGICQPGEKWRRATCNSKVVSARYYDRGISSSEEITDADYLSPRDGVGHGSHTTATAAGNHGIDVHIEGQAFGDASGMAPAARIAVYKVLWEVAGHEGSGTGDESDIVAAIDQSVRDGVDVINYSIGSTGGGDPFTDASNLAFMNAATAGVFVAASAGNDGATSTVGNNAPWETTTAASTSYLYQGAVRLGNGDSYVGAMVSDDNVPRSDLVYSGDIAADGADQEEAELCGPDTLDDAAADGTIVVCDRGIFDRVAKSAEVARAGGIGMVLTNVTTNSTDADFHAVPTVHLDVPDADAVRDYAQTNGATARIDASGADDTAVPQIAGFSSRGPAVPGEGDILKPDIAAPGVSIVAAVAPPSNEGRRWDLYSGTSMASPHIAGLAAFIHALRPRWSPMMIKSAMMTTAYNLQGNHHPFAQGAGHVQPRRFLQPGLVLDARGSDWMNFLSGQGVTQGNGDPLTPNPIDASNLNQPSIAIGDMAGSQTVRRTFTNVTGTTETYAISTRGLTGLEVDGPSEVTVPAGREKKVAWTFTATDDANMARYTIGKVVLTGDNGHVVRLPVAIRPIPLVAPDEVSGDVPAGQVVVRGKSGFSGEVDLITSGLVGSETVETTLESGPFDEEDPEEDADTYHDTLTVPAGGGTVRFRTDGDVGDDLDLFLYLGDTLLAASATSSADEQLTGYRVPAGTYDVYVNAFAGGDDVALRYDQWAVVPGDDAGNLTLDPDPLTVETGERFSYTAEWSGLDADQNWFGVVDYDDTGEHTYVSID